MLYPIKRIGSQSFLPVCRSFLQAEGLPFAEVLDAGTIEAAFEAENASFARGENHIYTPAVTLWAFLSQVLHTGRARSCVAAVSRVMGKETYATIPKTLTVRELKVRVAIRGFRVQQFVVVTTLTDAEHYAKDEIATLFRQRWHVELDLRNIKISLQMDDLRGMTPEMVRREIWAHWLVAINAATAATAWRRPRRQVAAPRPRAGTTTTHIALPAALDHPSVSQSTEQRPALASPGRSSHAIPVQASRHNLLSAIH